MLVKGTMDEWQSWTGMIFSDTGSYTVEGALAPIAISREADLGEYIEPNVG
jgi:hypothetical protein